MRRALFIAAVGLVLCGGCSLFVPKETLYLRSAQGKATQEEVRQNLGQPKKTAATPAGDRRWTYEVLEAEAGSQNSWSSFGSWCDEYVLTFDRQGILRHWTHRSQRHGGERMPTDCVDRDG